MAVRPWAMAMMALTILVAGCGQGEKGAGAHVDVADPVVLVLGSPNTTNASYPAILEFVDQIKKRTEGRVVVQSQYVDIEGDSSEPKLLSGVASGKWDLGWVGVRSLPRAGAPAFGALEAPMLIDDYAVQRAVLTSEIQSQLLAMTTPIGVEGLAVLGDHLRTPFSVKKPLVDLADYNGAAVWVTRTADAERSTITAWGGKVSELPFIKVGVSMQTGDIQGTITSANNMLDNDMHPPYMTVNEKLWPRALLLMANPAALAALDPADAAAVRAAAQDALAVSLTVGPKDDAAQLASICLRGTRAVLATDAQLAELRKAAEPVYADLRKDAQTADLLDRIAELKAGVTPEPVPVPAECLAAGPTPATSTVARPIPSRPPTKATEIDGTYRLVITPDALRSVGFTETSTPNGRKCVTNDQTEVNCLVENAGTFTYSFDRGTFTWSQRQSGAQGEIEGRGYYVVDGDDLVMVDDEKVDDGRTFDQRFTWTRSSDGSLTLQVDDEWNWSLAIAAVPWVRVS